MHGPDVAIVFHPEDGPRWQHVGHARSLCIPRRWKITSSRMLDDSPVPPRAVDAWRLDAHPFEHPLYQPTRVFLPVGEVLDGRRIAAVVDVIETREWRTCPLCGEGFDVLSADVRPCLSKRSDFDVCLWKMGDLVRCKQTAWRYTVTDRMRDALAFAAKCEPEQICDYASCKNAAIVPMFAESTDDVRMIAELEGWDVRRYNEDKRAMLLVKR